MKLSHSKLSLILNCPMSYYLTHEVKIWKKQEKTALWVGSAVHYGCEHGIEDLSDYFKEQGSFKQGDNYTREQVLAEAMCHGYLKHRDKIFEQLLTDPRTGEKLELLEEIHEIFLTSQLGTHEFVGIVDLLLLTNKGFILVDYKTSTMIPDWDSYLDQLYRYIFELRNNFPDTPIIKIGIINLRKTGIRQKKNENDDDFINRMKFEYDVNDEQLINYHEFLPSDLNEQHIHDYIYNLQTMADLAQNIKDNKLYFINYSAAKGQYGKSDFWDMFYKTPEAHVLYAIEDKIWDEDEQKFVESRDCVPIDMRVCEFATATDEDYNVLNKYEHFKQHLLTTETMTKEEFFIELYEHHLCDKELLERYWITFIKEKEVT